MFNTTNEDEELIESIKHMLQAFGEVTANGGRHYTGKEYDYTQSQGYIRVIALSEGKVILNSSGFSKEASEDDKAAMLSFKRVFQELEIPPPSKLPKFKL